MRSDLGNPRLDKVEHNTYIFGYDFHHFSTYCGGQFGTFCSLQLAEFTTLNCITCQSIFVMSDDRLPLIIVQAIKLLSLYIVFISVVQSLIY